MSVLKATTALEIVQDEKVCNRISEVLGDAKVPSAQVYLKSEADAVIAELKADNERLKKELEHSNVELESYFIFEEEIKAKLRATRRMLWQSFAYHMRHLKQMAIRGEISIYDKDGYEMDNRIFRDKYEKAENFFRDKAEQYKEAK